ncbi:hypothetical protein CAOG_09041 [Capsaspora owczarzaki ATCC 30864]|nr:hypothetical protein CAOG_09041 [Capsaspora owczarzaki ATCC 30864]|eukprot:XP_011270729.1 hypothetical protein CAOG_09041 [Capsaspora owczarzaki ATCC 30864]
MSDVELARPDQSNRPPPTHRPWRNWTAFFLMGMINNLGYVIVNAAAKSIADSFDEDNLIGAVPWANVAFGFVARGLNGAFMKHTSRRSYAARVWLNAAFMVVGLIALAFAPSFGLALAAICVVGMSSSFGESVILGYLRFFKSELVNSWSSGTGFAGIAGTLTYILFSYLGLSNRDTFLITLPSILIYLGAFFFVLVPPSKLASTLSESSNVEPSDPTMTAPDAIVPSASSTSTASSASTSSAGTKRKPSRRKRTSKNSEKQQLLDDDARQSDSDDDGDADADEPLAPGRDRGASHTSYSSTTATGILPGASAQSVNADPDGGLSLPPRETWFAQYWRCTKMVWFVSLQLLLVYVFEYVISGGAAAKVLTKADQDRDNFWYANSYAILGFCYQVGVFISRSSLQVVKFPRVEILTVLQGLNLIIWVVDDVYKFIPLWALLPMMIFVGLLGGASYVNVFHLVLTDENIPNEDRELCINLVAFGITIGITLGCSLILIFDNTFLSNA